MKIPEIVRRGYFNCSFIARSTKRQIMSNRYIIVLPSHYMDNRDLLYKKIGIRESEKREILKSTNLVPTQIHILLESVNSRLDILYRQLDESI